MGARCWGWGIRAALFVLCVAVIEALLLRASVSGVSLAAVPFFVGAFFPAAALLGALGAFCQRSWRGRLGASPGPWIAGLVLLGPALLAGALAGPPILRSVKTDWAASLGIAMASAGAYLALGALLGAPVARLTDAALGVAAARRPRLARAAQGPGLALAALATLGAAALLVALAAARSVSVKTPWWVAAAPAAAWLLLVAAFPLGRAVRRASPRLAAPLLAALALGLAAVGVWAWWGDLGARDGVSRALGRPGLVASGVRLMRAGLDGDGDGASAWLGGMDCAPGDPSRHPSALDVPGDGIDQDCRGGDARRVSDRYARGAPSHPRPDGAPRRPHVILVTADALSHTHTNLAGYGREVTPNLAAWARRATVFPNAFSTAPSTRLSFAGLLSGVYNAQSYLVRGRRNPYAWAPENFTMAEMFKERGYRTARVASDWYFVESHWPGVSQGFDISELTYEKRERHTGARITRSASRIIAEHLARPGDAPLFLWAHYFDQHHPYETPAGTERSYGTSDLDRYDDELRHADRHWGELLALIERTWEPDEYVLIFTADHGETFSGGHTHGYTLRSEVLDVPMVIQTEARRGESVPGLVNHLDLMPTLADLIGYPPRPEWSGESLLPVLYGPGAGPEKDAIFGLFYIPENDDDAFYKLSARDRRFHIRWDRRAGADKIAYRWTPDKFDRPVGDLSDEERRAVEDLGQLLSEELDRLRGLERGIPDPPAAP